MTSILPNFVLNVKSVSSLYVTETAPLNFTAESPSVLLVGTASGRIHAVDLVSYKIIETVYECPQEGLGLVSLSVLNGSHILCRVRGVGSLVLCRGEHRAWETEVVENSEFPSFCGSVASGSMVVCPCHDQSSHGIRILNYADDRKFNSSSLVAFDSVPFSICSSSLGNGNEFYVGLDSGSIHLLDGKSNKPLKTIQITKNPIFSIAASKDFLVIGSVNESIIVLDITDWNQRFDLLYPPESGGVSSLRFSPSGKTILAGFWDGTIRAFSLKKRKIILFVDYFSKSVSAVDWIDSKSFVAASSEDGKIAFWHLD